MRIESKSTTKANFPNKQIDPTTNRKKTLCFSSEKNNLQGDPWNNVVFGKHLPEMKNTTLQGRELQKREKYFAKIQQLYLIKFPVSLVQIYTFSALGHCVVRVFDLTNRFQRDSVFPTSHLRLPRDNFPVVLAELKTQIYSENFPSRNHKKTVQTILTTEKN